MSPIVRCLVNRVLLFAVGWVFCVFALTLPVVSASAETEDLVAMRTSQIRAGFLYYVFKFVEWPDSETDDSANRALYVCLIADEDLYRYSPPVFSGQLIHGREVAMRLYNSVDQFVAGGVDQCDAVFFGKKITEDVSQLMNELAADHVLTIGEREQFLDSGGMVRMFERNNRIRFEVNMEFVQLAGLRIKSLLLQLADRVVEAG